MAAECRPCLLPLVLSKIMVSVKSADFMVSTKIKKNLVYRAAQKNHCMKKFFVFYSFARQNPTHTRWQNHGNMHRIQDITLSA